MWVSHIGVGESYRCAEVSTNITKSGVSGGDRGSTALILASGRVMPGRSLGSSPGRHSCLHNKPRVNTK